MMHLFRMLLLYFIIHDKSCNSFEEIDFDPPNPENCTCVPYFQCSEETGKIITDGTGLFDVRYYKPPTQFKFAQPLSCNNSLRDFNKNSPCTGYFDVCCDSSEVQTSVDIDEQFPFAANIPENLPKPKGRGCGYQYPGSFPWTGALLYRDISLGQVRYKCGVSLIHPKVVLTAAHCLDGDTNDRGKGSWMIRVGHMSRDSAQVIVHPEYSDRSLHNDIALIILTKEVQLSAKVNPICIPSVGVRLDDAKCTVSVWAKDTTYLKMVNIPIVGRDACLKQLRQTRLGGYFQLHRSFICAGGEDSKDTCGGDGGSPLVCPVANQPGRYHQAGIVSWGIGCGEHNIPGVYVYLPLFRSWIDKVLLKKGIEITGYRY